MAQKIALKKKNMMNDARALGIIQGIVSKSIFIRIANE